MPIGLAVYIVACTLGQAGTFVYSIGWVLAEILGIGLLILLLTWLLKGRPPPERFFRNQPVIRFVRRFVKSDAAEGMQDDPDADQQQPQATERRPINTPGDFFRSSAPLDDLLATYSITKGLTEPIRFRRTPSSPNSGEDEDLNPPAYLEPGSTSEHGGVKIDIEAALSNARSKSPHGV